MQSDSTYLALAEALECRLALIADRSWVARDPQSHLAALGAVSEKIDTLVATLPRPIPSEMAHYLDRQSYDKALGWIRSQVLPLV